MCLYKMYTYINDLLLTIPKVPTYFIGTIKGIPTPYHSFFMLTVPTPWDPPELKCQNSTKVLTERPCIRPHKLY